MEDYELEKAAVEYANSIAQHDHNKVFSIDDFKAGAKWQYEQFEKNRLAACDNMTKEEAEREQEFVTYFLEKNLYAPTYSDAIEYGRKKVIDKAVEWIKLYILNHEYVDIFEIETAFKNELMEE